MNIEIGIAIILALIFIELFIIICKLCQHDDRLLGIEMNEDDHSKWLHSDMQKLWESRRISREIVFNELSRIDRVIIWFIKIKRGAK